MSKEDSPHLFFFYLFFFLFFFFFFSFVEGLFMQKDGPGHWSDRGKEKKTNAQPNILITADYQSRRR